MIPFFSAHHESIEVSERILLGNMNVDTGGSTAVLEVDEEFGEGIIGEDELSEPRGVSRWGEWVAMGDRSAVEVDSSLAVVERPVSVGVYRSLGARSK